MAPAAIVAAPPEMPAVAGNQLTNSCQVRLEAVEAFKAGVSRR